MREILLSDSEVTPIPWVPYHERYRKNGKLATIPFFGKGTSHARDCPHDFGMRGSNSSIADGRRMLPGVHKKMLMEAIPPRSRSCLSSVASKKVVCCACPICRSLFPVRPSDFPWHASRWRARDSPRRVTAWPESLLVLPGALVVRPTVVPAAPPGPMRKRAIEFGNRVSNELMVIPVYRLPKWTVCILRLEFFSELIHPVHNNA